MVVDKRNIYFEKLILFAFMFLPLLTISIYLDNDSWFLLNHGKYVLEHGIPSIEPFTIHENLQFVMQQWLFSVLYWIVYSNLGKWGVLACLYLLGSVLIILIYKLCMQLSGEKFYLSVVITVCVSLVICAWYTVSRPQVITYLVILIEILYLEKYVGSQKWKYLIVLPVLSIIEINLHASMWGLLFAFELPYIIEAFHIKIGLINNKGYKKIPLFVTTALMFIAGFVNPYGGNAILYITKSYGKKIIDENVTEMAAPIVRNIPGLVFFIILFLIACVYILNKKGETRLRFILLLLGTTLLALLSQKSMPYFLVGGIIPLAYFLKNQAHQLKFGNANKKKDLLLKGSCVLFLVLILVVALSVHIDDYDGTNDYPTSKNAIEYLENNADADAVCLYTSYFDGGYAEYRGFKVYMDARAEVFLKDNNLQKDIFEEYILLQRGGLHYKEFLARYDFTHILVSESDLLSVYLKEDSNYQVIYEDTEYKIYIPIDKTEVENE